MSKTNSQPKDSNPYPFWAPRFWHGMLIGDWIRLLSQQRYRVHPARWPLALGITFATLFNSKMRLTQTAFLGHKTSQTDLPDDPLFVLGHWRSGTTLLHELLSVDGAFATPTTYQCFAANHFLLTEAVITRLLWFLMPSKRPMDNMKAGWHEPQEDEFALCSMGVPSPYLRMAFPNSAKEYLDYLDTDLLDDGQRKHWQSTFEEFLRRLAVHYPGKRIVLKSPTHTARLGLLANMFPNAKFIHIVRNPYDVVPSTIRLWNSLDYVQGLQIPRGIDREDYVFRTYQCMYDAFERHRSEIPEARIIEIQFEHLVEDSCSVLANVYDQLSLGDFADVRPQLEAKLASKRNYIRNQHELDEGLIERINHHWHWYFEKYGYPMR